MAKSKKSKRSSGVSYLQALTNRYVLVILCFLVWMTFFDRHRIGNSIYLSRTIDKLELSKTEYSDLIAEARKEKELLDEESEKYAREKFYMHKENEDVFVIEK